MRFFLLSVLFVSLLQAQERPKIALVLSGGGARGAAHVGVLKVLEENHIPVDMIVGTSMGSFMGGLYAAGWKPDDMAEMLIDTDWNRYIRADFDRVEIPMHRKMVEYIYQGRLGVGINANNEIVLPTGVLKREPLLLKFDELTQNVHDIKDFDKLPIPYRAVATDIKNGNAVVLKSGSLAEAIYASSAIPGGLQPININGIDLVDGGVSNNIPIDVARKMGADIIIAVDVSENFSDKVDVNSYLVVMGQLVDILMRKNANESIKTLGKKDILITPDLNGYTGLDVEKYKEIIQSGYEAANKNIEKLKKLVISQNAYKEYRQKYRKEHQAKQIIIDAIEIKSKTYLSNDIIKEEIRQKIGHPFNAQALREDILNLYNLTIFDSITYDIKKRDGHNILVITTTPSWNNNGDLLFSLSLDDDFKGHSSYSLKIGYFMYGVNSLGAEWHTNIEIGKKQHYSTEFYQPLDNKQMFYVRPFLGYEKMTYIVPTEAEGNQELESIGYGGGIGFGINISRVFRSELSLGSYEDRAIVKLFQYDERLNARQMNLKFLYDSLDNYTFPNSGLLAKLNLKKDAKVWGSDYDYEQIYLDLQKPLSYFDSSFIVNFKFGKTDIKTAVKTAKGSPAITVYDKFSLGGMFNLSGYQAYTFEGNNIIFGSIMYRYRIKNGGFFGSLGMPLYAGVTAESGTVWDDGDVLHGSDVKYSASLYLAADTPLGAFYFTYGSSDSGDTCLYLTLGEKF